jgi:SAM-dependent methyltransferase
VSEKNVLEANRRLHAREGADYLDRHPEQTNFFQARHHRAMIDRIVHELPPDRSRLLDLGCGTGYFTLPLLARGFRVTAVDLSPDLTAILKLRCPPEHRSRLRVADMDVATFADADAEIYDGIIFSALLHHLYDYQSILARFCKKLRPSGLLLVFFEPLNQPRRPFLIGGLHRVLAAVDEFIYNLQMRRRRIPLLNAEYRQADFQRNLGGIDPERVRQILTEEGMDVTVVEKYSARRYGLCAWMANRLLHTQNSFDVLAKKKLLA